MRRVTPRRFLLALLALLALSALLYRALLYRATDPRGPRDRPQRTHTVILSSWRSGSSFLGQVFNRHPEVFYVMEPVKHVWAAMPSAGELAMRGAARDLLRSLLACDHSALRFYMRGSATHLRSLFLFHTSAALCRPPACPAATPATRATTPANASFDCRAACGWAPLDGVGLACEASRHVVVKSVRFFGLRSLRGLLSDATTRLKVIHLVRDPRAVLASRRRLPPAYLRADNRVLLGRDDVSLPEHDLEVMARVCRGAEEIAADAERLLGDAAAGLRGAYTAVRYEDLVRWPGRTARDLFRFAGIAPSAAVEEWAHFMTRGRGDADAAGFDVVRLEWRVAASRWRRGLALDDARAVQDACRGAMARFRYREFHSEEELRNQSVESVY